MRTRTLAVLPTAAALLTACGTDADPSGSTPEIVTETIGDTTVVRTLSGSVWGAEATLVPEVAIGELDGPEEYLFGSIRSIAVADDGTIHVLDVQAQHVRVFDSLGVFVETLGRRGEGPGEFSEAEAIAVLPDGRSKRGLNPDRKSSNYLQGCTICVSCRCTGP
ncbi:MAG: 6-bladed beta-propeller, partial [Gemmatimonadetes bacterium]|nr:6-bladed beta-propeller [Gemmatimonadota bacterium]